MLKGRTDGAGNRVGCKLLKTLSKATYWSLCERCKHKFCVIHRATTSFLVRSRSPNFPQFPPICPNLQPKTSGEVKLGALKPGGRTDDRTEQNRRQNRTDDRTRKPSNIGEQRLSSLKNESHFHSFSLFSSSL